MSRRETHSRPGNIAVLDIGGHKSACFVANLSAEGAMEISGVGHMLSKGLRGGMVTDAAEVETSIITAVHSAEEMAETQIEKILVSLTLPHIRSRHYMIDLNLGQEPFQERDLQDLMQEAIRTIPEGETLLHAMPFRFDLDGQHHIRDPRGMVGDKLNAHLLLVTAPENLLRNLTHCISRCQLEVEGYVSSAYAAGLACLEEDEKELGAVIIDLGAFSTGYAVFFGGKLVHTGSIGVGSHHITQDIAQGLHTSISQAERLKTVHGSAIVSPADDTTLIDVYPIGAESEEEAAQEKRSHLNQIIRPRVEEIFELTKEAIDHANLGALTGNRVILSGGGSQLLGIAELAGKIFDKPIRLASPMRIEGLADATSGPAFASPIGMLTHARLLRSKAGWMHRNSGGLKGKSFGQLVRWFKENF
jgi:cell division protein FtsA